MFGLEQPPQLIYINWDGHSKAPRIS